MIFLFGFIWWGYKRIRPRLLAELESKSPSVYWRLTAWFWIGFGGWLVNAQIRANEPVQTRITSYNVCYTKLLRLL